MFFCALFFWGGGVAKICIFQIPLSHVILLDFLCLLKHYKIGISANCCVFCRSKRRQKPPKMITGISGFGFLSKNDCFVTVIFFSKNWFAETLVLKRFAGCSLFGPSCKKGEILDPEIKTDNFD